MDLLAPYGQYWFVTITSYGKDIEPNVPEKETVMDGFRELSGMVGIDSVCWRYDPILISDVYSAERVEIGKAFAEIGCRYGMTVKACAEGNDLAPYGIDCSGCMTVETYEQALHCRLDVPKRKPVRRECACYLANDIGAYDTCGHLCRYCYANANASAVRQNMKLHNPESPFLIGESHPDDQIHEAKQESCIERQLSLF